MPNLNNRDVKSHRSEAGHRGLLRLIGFIVLALIAGLVFVFARSVFRKAMGDEPSQVIFVV